MADIGGTYVRIGAIVAGAIAAAARQVATSSIRTGDIVSSLSRLIASFFEEIGGPPDSVVVTVPGFLDRDFDRVLYTPNVPELHGIALGSALTHKLGCRVMLERDAVLLLRGEQKAGAARGRDDVLGIFFGTGIGAAFLSERRPFRGGGWALEIGYLPVNGEGDDRILEDVCSGRALQQLALDCACPIEQVFTTPSRHPIQANRIEAVIEQQALAIVTAIFMISPRHVVLGGGVVEMASYPRDEILARVKRRLRRPGLVSPELSWAELGWRSALYGALAVAEGVIEAAEGIAVDGA